MIPEEGASLRTPHDGEEGSPSQGWRSEAVLRPSTVLDVPMITLKFVATHGYVARIARS
jgi:hypothetical protein